MEALHTESLERSIERLKDMINARNKKDDKREINYWFTPRAFHYLDECLRLRFIGDLELNSLVGSPNDAIDVYTCKFQKYYPECSFEFKIINPNEHDYIIHVTW